MQNKTYDILSNLDFELVQNLQRFAFLLGEYDSPLHVELNNFLNSIPKSIEKLFYKEDVAHKLYEQSEKTEQGSRAVIQFPKNGSETDGQCIILHFNNMGTLVQFEMKSEKLSLKVNKNGDMVNYAKTTDRPFNFKLSHYANFYVHLSKWDSFIKNYRVMLNYKKNELDYFVNTYLTDGLL